MPPWDDDVFKFGIIFVFIVAFVLAGCLSARADDIRLKAGYELVPCPAVSDAVNIGVSKQLRLKMFAIEGELLGTTAQVQDVGQLWAVQPALTLKMYLGSVYFGAGAGYYFNYIRGADCDDEVVRFGEIGYETKEWVYSLRLNISDLDIETGANRELEIEKNSRFDGITLSMGRKF